MPVAICSPEPSSAVALGGNDCLIISERPRPLWSWHFPAEEPRHVTVSAPRRVIVVGDPHGCFDEFEELMRKCAFDTSAGDAVVIVGDLVNKGPKSVEMIRAARDTPGIWSLRGNHEDNVLRDYYKWKQEGVEPKEAWLKRLEEPDVSYLERLPFTCALPQHNALVVHAGLVPGKRLEEQADGDMVRMRNLALLSDIDETGKTTLEWVASERDGIGVPWASVWRGPHVFFGHDAIRKLQQYENATGLDTGCCYGFQLTAAILDPEKPSKPEIIHVQAHAEYEKPSKK